MKAGLMGGTFDPIHLGHLRAAENARRELGLDRVLFMPTGEPPHRPSARASARDRLVMTELAVSSHALFMCSDLEVQREGRSYTVETLEALRALHPDVAWTLILGSDAFAEMGSWKEPRRVLDLAEVAVVRRPGDEARTRPYPARDVTSSELPLSSTQIRAQLLEGGSVRYLVPDAVADYIVKRGLYR